MRSPLHRTLDVPTDYVLRRTFVHDIITKQFEGCVNKMF